VQRSDQAVIVADQEGRILMTSQAFEALLPSQHPQLDHLEALPELFEDRLEVRHRLRELLRRSQTWRGEAELVGVTAGTRPVLVRADPVFSAPERVLGFVVIVADMLERKAADAARRSFQARIVEGTRFATGRLESRADLLYQNLLSSVVDNAQLAALEITDGVEVGRMPELLDSVRSSVDRSAKLLHQLIRHTIKSPVD
jgi:PAS domain S-box-containing protein